jgi:hypothetical protein
MRVAAQDGANSFCGSAGAPRLDASVGQPENGKEYAAMLGIEPIGVQNSQPPEILAAIESAASVCKTV